MKTLLALLALCGTAVSASAATSEDFLRAIRANDLETLRKLTAAGIAGVKDKLDWTPLHHATVFGNPASVRILAEAGADPNARNSSKATPLMYAAWNLEMTKILVEKGGDVNAQAADGSTPFLVAAGVQSNGATIRYLLENGANTKVTSPTGDDYLIRASGAQDAATLRLLLARGLDAHRANGSGLTALSGSVVCDGS